MDDTPIEINWTGPFRWPGIENGSNSLSNFPGIYLWTVEYLHGGYLIYAAGITRRPMKKRFREHTHAYLNGIYTLFDMEAMKQGIRTEIWHGFWTKKRAEEKQREHERRKTEYDQPPPFSGIPDRGMMLASRWQSEMPIFIRNNSSTVLHGLPERMVI